MPSVVLVRHGQARAGGLAGGLTERGLTQTVRTGEALRERGVVATSLVSGTLARQTETADAVGPLVGGGACARDPRWNEYDVLALLTAYGDGSRTGTRTRVLADDQRALQTALDAALLRWQQDGSGGERLPSWADFAGGAEAALRDVARSLDSGQTAVVVTSAGPTAALVGRLLGLPAEAVVALHRVWVNGSTTKLVTGRSGVSVVSLNEHGHLERRHPTHGDLVTYR